MKIERKVLKGGGVTEVTIATADSENFYTCVSLWDNIPKHFAQTMTLNAVIEISRFWVYIFLKNFYLSYVTFYLCIASC